jgi:hypothetical protein
VGWLGRSASAEIYEGILLTLWPLGVIVDASDWGCGPLLVQIGSWASGERHRGRNRYEHEEAL